MCTLAALLPLLFLPRTAGAADPSPRPLTPDRPIAATLTGKEVHEYEIALDRGQALHVVVDQRGLDVVEELRDPAGTTLLRVDSPRGGYGPEAIWIVAERAGLHRLRIQALDEEVAGSYEVRIARIGSSTADDRARARAEWIHMRGRTFEDRTSPEARRQSLADLEQATALWAAVGDPEQEALAWLDRARALQAQGDSRGSLEKGERALEKARAASDRQLEAKILSSVGLSRESLGDPAGGVETLAKALALSRSVGDRQQEAGTLHFLAWGYWNLGRYQEALDFDQQSLSLARSIRDRPLEAWASNGLGLTYSALGEPERALESYGAALLVWRRISDRWAEAFTLQNLGFAYWSLDRKEKALAAFQQALPIVRALGDRHGEAFALNNIGLAQTDLGEASSSLATLTQALSLWRATGDKHGEALSLHNLGRSYEVLGRPAEAVAAWGRALSEARAIGDRRSEATTLASLALLENRRGNLDEARLRIEAALALVESQRGEIAAAGLRSSFLSSKQDYYAISMDVLLGLDARDPGLGYAASAFEMSERGRARSLLEGIAEARLDFSQDLPEDLRGREKDLGARIGGLQKELSNPGARRPALEGELGRAEDEWELLISEMRRRTPRYASLRYPEPVSAARAMAALDPASALVSFSIDADRVLVFVLTSSRLFVRRLPIAPAALSEQVGDFVGLVARDDEDRWTALGNRLYTSLVAPWRGELPPTVTRLIIVPDAALCSLPFEALSSSATSSHFLVEDFVVSYAPSATALAQLAPSSARSAVTADLLVVADPSVRGAASFRETMVGGERFDIAPLPHAESEARAIARFGGPGTVVYTGADASEARVRSAPLERFGVVHFATHGLLSHRNPSRSALLLAAEGPSQGLLTAREIYRLKLPADLVVLSACETARGRILAGEGVQGLTQAFFHAGARSVVASLWDVNDRRTERLMLAFYGHLADQEPKAEALARAKRDLLASEPDLAPRYWAPFVLIGESRATVSLRPMPAWRRFVEAARQWLFDSATRNVNGPSRAFSSGPSTSTTQ